MSVYICGEYCITTTRPDCVEQHLLGVIYPIHVRAHVYTNVVLGSWNIYWLQSGIGSLESPWLWSRSYMMQEEKECERYIYSGNFLLWTPLGQLKVSWLERCPYLRGVLIEGFICKAGNPCTNIASLPCYIPLSRLHAATLKAGCGLGTRLYNTHAAHAQS